MPDQARLVQTETHVPPNTSRRRRRVDPTALILLGPALLVVLVLFIYPFVYGLTLSLLPAKGGPFANYINFFADPRERATIWVTLRIALPATLLNILIAIPLAYRMRTRIGGQRLITALFVIPMTLGTVLIAQGMLNFFGPAGWFNKVLVTIGILNRPIRLVHNYIGVVISLMVAEFPVVFLVLLSYTSGIDPNLERAARMLGANAWRRFRRVMLPLMMPGIAIAFALSFVATFAVLPSAVLVGEPAGATRVIALAAWQAAYERFDYSAASAIAMIMAAIELLFIALVLFVRSRLYSGPATGGKG